MKKVDCIAISFLFVCFVTFVSCSKQTTYQNETRVDWKDFKEVELKGKTLTFNEPIMKPLQLLVHDSLLITMNSGTAKACHIYNLRTGKKIGERMSLGQGPDEVLVPFFIYSTDSVKIFDMITSKVRSFSFSEFVSNPVPVPARIYKVDVSNLFSELASLQGKLVGVSYRAESPCFLFDENGKKQNMKFGTYPEGPVKYTPMEIQDAYRAILTSNQKDRVAVCHFFTDLIDIFNEKGELVKRLYGPEHFYTRFVEFKEGDRIGSKPDPSYYRDAFYSPTPSGDNFCVLFNGKFVNKPEYNVLAKDILVFGWDGTPKIDYKLDLGVSRIFIDNQSHKIYGISNDPEYHIVEFPM